MSIDTINPPEAVLYEPIIRIKPDNISIGAGSRIDGFVKLEGGIRLSIGRYVHVASFSHLGIGGGTLIIGDFVAIASGAKILSGSGQIDALSISACAPEVLQRKTKGVTELCSYSCVFCNGIVLPDVQLGEGAVLAAGSIATKNIPPWEVWGGWPARFMSKRVVVHPSWWDK